MLYFRRYVSASQRAQILTASGAPARLKYHPPRPEAHCFVAASSSLEEDVEVLDYRDDHDRDYQGEQARQHHPEVVEQRHLGAEGKIHTVGPKFAS